MIDQTHRKAEETLDFKMTRPKETMTFKPLISVEGSWMTGLTDLEVYNSTLNITEENNEFNFYNFPDDKSGGVSYIKVTDEIEKDLDFEDITAAELQDGTIAPKYVEEYKEQVS